MGALEHYYQEIKKSRAAFANGTWAQTVFSNDLSEDDLLQFLIWYCALGVKMTCQVEKWIYNAGVECEKLNLFKLGASLKKHAQHEAGHDELFVNDTYALVARYNKSHGKSINAIELFEHPPTPAIKRYIDLHERNNAGPSPYCQLAIELEIERLSVIYGPRLIEKCQLVLGHNITKCLTFISDHAALDEGHTKFNTSLLRQLLNEHPGYLGNLVAAGSEALAIYGDFLKECLLKKEL